MGYTLRRAARMQSVLHLLNILYLALLACMLLLCHASFLLFLFSEVARRAVAVPEQVGDQLLFYIVPVASTAFLLAGLADTLARAARRMPARSASLFAVLGGSLGSLLYSITLALVSWLQLAKEVSLPSALIAPFTATLLAAAATGLTVAFAFMLLMSMHYGFVPL